MIFFEIGRNLPAVIEQEVLARAAQTALRSQSAPEPGDLTIVLTDDSQLHELNVKYLQVDAPTDVLSFPAHESDPETGRAYLGDIIISVPRAAAQAEAAGHPVASELQLLVVHGVLHILGHDHAEREEKARMWAAQAAILKELGLGDIKVGEA